MYASDIRKRRKKTMTIEVEKYGKDNAESGAGGLSWLNPVVGCMRSAESKLAILDNDRK